MAVIDIIISYDSRMAISICRNEQADEGTDDYVMQAYSLTSFRSLWSLEVEGTFMKMCEIQQSDDASMFALPYQDNGVFHCKIVDNQGKQLAHINVNDLLGLDNLSKPIHGLYNPGITCAFLPNKRLFVSAYHRIKKT